VKKLDCHRVAMGGGYLGMLGPKSRAGTEQLSLAGSGCEATDYLVCGGKETDVILVPIRARVEGPSTFVSLISGLDSNKEDTTRARGRDPGDGGEAIHSVDCQCFGNPHFGMGRDWSCAT